MQALSLFERKEAVLTYHQVQLVTDPLQVASSTRTFRASRRLVAKRMLTRPF
jgi:hypothetical protein